MIKEKPTVKKMILVLVLASVTTLAIAADSQAQVVNGERLLLTKSITPGDGIDSVGEPVVLIEPKANGCQYIGELRQGQSPNDLGNKIVDSGVQDNHVWSIHISRKVCESKTEPVALTIDLGRPSRFEAGLGVLAQPAQ